jgi:hypothetical protein
MTMSRARKTPEPDESTAMEVTATGRPPTVTVVTPGVDAKPPPVMRTSVPPFVVMLVLGTSAVIEAIEGAG